SAEPSLPVITLSHDFLTSAPYISDHLFFYVFFHSYGDHRKLHSFPTRRSSDLPRAGARLQHAAAPRQSRAGHRYERARHRGLDRSEEHTSELQSPYDLVCRLLLEKKKQLQNIKFP